MFQIFTAVHKSMFKNWQGGYTFKIGAQFECLPIAYIFFARQFKGKLSLFSLIENVPKPSYLVYKLFGISRCTNRVHVSQIIKELFMFKKFRELRVV